MKKLTEIKLTFLLIIFVIAGIYLLEQNASLKWKQVIVPENFIRKGTVQWTVLDDQGPSEKSAAAEMPRKDKPEPDVTAQSFERGHSLCDLGLHLEL